MYLKDHFATNIIATINPDVGTFYKSVNYNEIDKFVKTLIVGYSKKVSRMKFFSDVNDEHVADNETENFLTHILEVGALQVISDNMGKNMGSFLVSFAVEALDVAVAKNLTDLGFLNGRTFYYGASNREITNRVSSFLKQLQENNIPLSSVLGKYLNQFLYSKI